MKKVLSIALIMLFLFSGCTLDSREENLGVITLKKSYSYDKKYYAVMDYVEYDGVNTAIVDVYLTVDDSRVQAVKICKKENFSGYCWEKDSHNIWVEYADSSFAGYVYNGKSWKKDSSLSKPDYVI